MADGDIKHDQLVVAAIDFGTTYSGFAYCTRHDYKDYLKRKDLDNPKIDCPTWTARGWMNYKAPTCILFNPKQNFHSFGYEAREYYQDNPDKQDFTKWFYFEHFKMMLYREKKPENYRSAGKMTDKMYDHMKLYESKDELTKDTWLKESINLEGSSKKGMKAVDVFAAVISHFQSLLVEKLQTGYGANVFSNDDIHWVLTVPAIWDLKAKQFMRDAAEKAKISNNQLTLALEPEAASIHCRRQPVTIATEEDGNKAIAGMQKGDKYVVFDQGGGTTDITVHEVTGPNTIKEIHQACGGHWGGTTVNGEFYKFLVRLFGSDVINDVKENHAVDYFELMHTFEQTKTNFTNDSEQVIIRLPIVWLTKYTEITKKTLKEVIPQTNFKGKIEIKLDKLKINPVLFRTFFDYSINNVTVALESLFQKEELRDVDTLLAVGGFSESKILIDAIKEKLGPDITVIVPNNPGLAVLKGAVMYGFEPEIITSRVSRYTYGVAMQRHFMQGVDAESHRNKMVDDVFDIHVRKGKVVEIGQFEPEHSYFPMLDDQMCAYFEFFATEKTDPKYTTDNDCKLIGILSVDLTKNTTKGGKRELLLKINASGTEIVAVVKEKATGNMYRAYFSLF